MNRARIMLNTGSRYQADEPKFIKTCDTTIDIANIVEMSVLITVFGFGC